MARCNRPGCGGELDASGRCWVCLMPPLSPQEAEAEARRAASRAHDEHDVSNRPAAAPRQEAAHVPAPRIPAPGNPPTQIPAAPLHASPSTTASGEDAWWALRLYTPAPIVQRVPNEAVLADTTISNDRRKCSKCRRPVGFGHDGQPARDEGKCPYDGTPYAFVPRLRRGDVVGGRYRIEGCIGFGGFGWVYLGYDQHLEDRPVALKGLIDADSPRAVDEAQEEKRFLIRFKHEDIVEIRDFVAHVTEDHAYHVYIVMEYVPGYALTDEHAPALGVEDVVWCVLRTLRVFDYLHQNGYLFCDLKPSNLMVHGAAVKVIDLGAVREVGATGTGTYTVEYAAPELPVTGPTAATDVYTVGVTLGELLYQHADDPEAPQYASLRAVIDRAVAPVHRRFATASEMASQLSGVLRDLVALREQRAIPAPPLHFARATALIDNGLGSVPAFERWMTLGARRAAESGISRALDTRPPRLASATAGLPEPLPDAHDPAAGFLAAMVSADPAEAARQLEGYQARTAGVEFHQCRLLLRLGDTDGAAEALGRAEALAPGDWRADWHRGLLALARGRFAEAHADFAACAAALPGELAPRLALAVCAEYLADDDAALAEVATAYLSVWNIDSWYESAALGCARVRARLGDRSAAVSVLADVPDTSPHYRSLRIAAFRIRTGRLGAAGEQLLPGAAELTEAEREVPAIALGASEAARLNALVAEAALDRIRALGPQAGRPPRTGLFADAHTEGDLRLGLSGQYRALARHAPQERHRTVLVDLANTVRPTTLT